MLSTTWLSCVPVVLVISGAAVAQTRATTADLEGIVYDQSRAILAGAQVSATNSETGLTRDVVTAGDGRFILAALVPGSYTVRVQAPGFAPLIRESIVLTLGVAVNLELTMTVAGAVEKVTVSGG